MKVQLPEAFTPLWTKYFEHYAFFGGRGGAKSHSIAEAVAGVSSIQEERVVCGRQYQNSIKDSVKELLEKKIHKLNMSVFWTSTNTELVNVSTGSRISFIGMDRNPESAKSLEGASLFWGEEAQMFTPRSMEIIIPTIRDLGSRMVWSWNPRDRRDSVDAMFRGAHPPEKSYVRQVGYADNPWFYQTRMPSEMRRLRKVNPKRAVHVWDGGYDENPDAAIFSNWSVGRVPVPEKCIPRYAVDFGFGADPNFAVKLYVIEELQTIYITHEAVAHKLPLRNLPELIDTLPGVRDYPLIGDSSRPEDIEYLNSKGFNVFGARKGAGSIKNGINFLQGYHIVIAPECVNIQEEFRDYKWKLDPNEKPLPIPAEYQQDHGIDAVRYAVEELSTIDMDALEDDGGVIYV